MNAPDARAVNRLLKRMGVALLQGGMLWWLYRSTELELWPYPSRGWLVGLIAATILVPIAHYLMADLSADRRRFWVLPPLALALFGFGWHHGAWTVNEPRFDSMPFALALGVLVFHALPFVQAWLANRRLRPAYEDLFHFAWRNTLLLALSGVFCGVFWLLLWLWGALFRMLGVNFFIDLFTEAYFAIPATTVAAGVGMQLAGSVERLQNVLRNQLLTMLKWLAPLAFLILAMFSLALIVESPELLLEQRRVISAAWLLWLVALAVALLNTAYQDGRIEAPYPGWLGKAIRLIVPLLLPVSALAAYAIGIRIGSYGLTVARVWGLLVAIIAFAYASGYAWSALRKQSWMGGMGAVNVHVALATVLLLSLMLSPVLSPERLAAASQQARVLENFGSDAYQYLHFNSGRYGRARLERLAELQDHPQAASIRAAAAAELEKKWPAYLPMQADLSTASFMAFPAGSPIDAELMAALKERQREAGLWQCLSENPCPLLFVDLNRDGMMEALVFNDYHSVAFRRNANGWKKIDSPGSKSPRGDRAALRKALAEQRYAIREPAWQILEIEGQLYVLEEAVGKSAAEPEPVTERVQ